MFLFEGDISLRQTVDNLVSFAMHKCGRIDVLVNNTGVLVQKNFQILLTGLGNNF